MLISTKTNNCVYNVLKGDRPTVSQVSCGGFSKAATKSFISITC